MTAWRTRPVGAVGAVAVGRVAVAGCATPSPAIIETRTAEIERMREHIAG